LFADHEEAVGVERLARTHHVVPPADVLRVIRVDARDVMRRIERMTDEHRIAARGVERAIGLDHEVVPGQRRAVLQLQRLVEMQCLRSDDADRFHSFRLGFSGG